LPAPHVEPHPAELLASCGALGAHRQQRLHPPFVTRPPRLDPLTEPGFFLGELLVELRPLHGLAGQPFLLLADEGRIVTWPRREPAAIELDDPGREPLEKGAVVGDEDHRAGIFEQEGLEPLDRLDVEMVGRLVEEQQVGLRDQRPGQQHAPLPSAGQGVDRDVGRQAEAGQHQLDALLQSPAITLLQLVLQGAEPVERTRAAVVDNVNGRVMVSLHQAGQVAEPLGDDVEHRRRCRQRDVLLEPRDPGPRLTPHRTSIGRQLPAQDLEERGLAGPVSADDGHALPRLDLECDIVEQRQVTVGVMEVIDRDERHGSQRYYQNRIPCHSTATSR